MHRCRDPQILHPEILIQEMRHQHFHSEATGIRLPRSCPFSYFVYEFVFVFAKHFWGKNITHRPVIHIRQEVLHFFYTDFVIFDLRHQQRMQNIFIIISVRQLFQKLYALRILSILLRKLTNSGNADADNRLHRNRRD